MGVNYVLLSKLHWQSIVCSDQTKDATGKFSSGLHKDISLITGEESALNHVGMNKGNAWQYSGKVKRHDLLQITGGRSRMLE